MTIRGAILCLCITFFTYGCQKDNTNSKATSVSLSEQDAEFQSDLIDHLSKDDILLQIDTDFDFSQYGLTPNYDYSKVIDLENIDEKHVYIPLMNSSNEMVDLFLGLFINGKFSFQYFSNSNVNNIKNETYNFFFESIINGIIPNNHIRVDRVFELETRGDDILCVGWNNWTEYVPQSGASIDDGCLYCYGYEIIEHSDPYTYDCGGGGFGTGQNGPTPNSGGGGSNTVPRPDEIFDDCLNIIGVASLTDLQAAQEYHNKCGCDGFVLRVITTADIEELYEFNNSVELDRCKRDICKYTTFMMLENNFAEISTPCTDENLDWKELYRRTILSTSTCNPSMSDIYNELNEISGGNYYVRSDYGYSERMTISTELVNQLSYLTDGCNANLEGILNALNDDEICSLISSDPNQLGNINDCNLESICLMTDILVNGEAAIPDDYPEGFFDCVLSNDEIGDDVLEQIYLSSCTSDILAEFFVDTETNFECADRNLKRNVPCGDVIFSNAYFGFRYVQFDVNEKIFFYGCFNNFFHFHDFKFNFQAELPSHLFTGSNEIMGFGTQQNNIARVVTDAIDFAASRIDLGIGLNCDFEAYMVSLRSEMLSYLQTPEVLVDIWGSSSNQVKLKLNYSIDVPLYTPQRVELTTNENAFNCN